MSFAKKAIKTIGGGLVGLVAGSLLKKRGAVSQSPLTSLRDEARERAERDTEFARRKGARADRVSGTGNASGASIRLVTGS